MNRYDPHLFMDLDPWSVWQSALFCMGGFLARGCGRGTVCGSPRRLPKPTMGMACRFRVSRLELLVPRGELVFKPLDIGVIDRQSALFHFESASGAVLRVVELSSRFAGQRSLNGDSGPASAKSACSR